MATKKKVINPLDFPKEIFVYDDEYFTRKDEIDNAEMDEEDLEDVILTDPCYIIVDGTLSLKLKILSMALLLPSMS